MKIVKILFIWNSPYTRKQRFVCFRINSNEIKPADISSFIEWRMIWIVLEQRALANKQLSLYLFMLLNWSLIIYN